MSVDSAVVCQNSDYDANDKAQKASYMGPSFLCLTVVWKRSPSGHFRQPPKAAT